MNALKLFAVNAKLNVLTLLYFFRAVKYLWKLIVVDGKATSISVSEAKNMALSSSQFTELYTLKTLAIQLEWNKKYPNDRLALVDTTSHEDE